jgi:hypothetical protein
MESGVNTHICTRSWDLGWGHGHWGDRRPLCNTSSISPADGVLNSTKHGRMYAPLLRALTRSCRDGGRMDNMTSGVSSRGIWFLEDGLNRDRSHRLQKNARISWTMAIFINKTDLSVQSLRPLDLITYKTNARHPLQPIPS